MGIRTEEVVEPREALEKILAIVTGAQASRKRPREEAALLKRIVRAANRGLIGEEDWPYITEKEKVSATFLAEQDKIVDLDDETAYWRRKYADKPKRTWPPNPPPGHPHHNPEG
jgi:hypothetical protein